MLLYLSLTALLMATFLIMRDEAFTGDGETAMATLLLLLLFGWATLPLASLVSFGFRSPSNALIAMIGFYFLSGFGLIVADFIMSSVRSRPCEVAPPRELGRTPPTRTRRCTRTHASL